MQPQVAFLKEPDKMRLLAGLNEASADWFDPTVLWKHFLAAVLRITPSGMHTIAESPHYAAKKLTMAENAEGASA